METSDITPFQPKEVLEELFRQYQTVEEEKEAVRKYNKVN